MSNENIYFTIMGVLFIYLVFRIIRTAKRNADPLNIELMHYFADDPDREQIRRGAELFHLAIAVENSGGLSFKNRLVHVATMVKSNHSYTSEQKNNALAVIRALYVNY